MPLMDEANEFDPTQDLATFQAEREEETRVNRSEVLDQFKSARRKAVGHLHLVATQVAATQEDDVAGTKLAAEFYEHVANGLSRSDVAGMFSTQTGANEAQVIELESVRDQLDTAEQQLDRSNQTNEQLRRSALEASNLQAQLLTTQQDLIAARDQITELQDEIVLLKSDKSVLQRELNDEKQAHGMTKDELGAQRQQPTEIIDPVLTPPAPPAAASSDESDDNGGLAADETPPPLTHKEEMERRRGIRGAMDRARDILPGSSNPHNTPKEGEK